MKLFIENKLAALQKERASLLEKLELKYDINIDTILAHTINDISFYEKMLKKENEKSTKINIEMNEAEKIELEGMVGYLIRNYEKQYDIHNNFTSFDSKRERIATKRTLEVLSKRIYSVKNIIKKLDLNVENIQKYKNRIDRANDWSKEVNLDDLDD